MIFMNAHDSRIAVILVVLVAALPAAAQPEGLPVDELPPGKYLLEGDMIISQQQKDDLEAKGAFETNLWPGGVVPYEFVTDSNTAVDTYTGTGFVFVAGNPPMITSADSAFAASGSFDFLMGEEVRVSGSGANDNAGSGFPGYVITAASATQITLTSGDPIVAENATAYPVTLYTTRSVSPLNQTRFVDAVANWEAAANIDFRPRSGETDYILIRNSKLNRSDLGMQTGDPDQDFEMHRWSNEWIIVHEAGHTLGLKHEHTRNDRDTFVDIIWANVDQSACGGSCDGNFAISETVTDYPTGPAGVYDFDSLMHYSESSWAAPADSVTIRVYAPWWSEWQGKIGQRNHLSFWDQKVMSFLYPEPDWRFLHASTAAFPRDGSFIAPHNDLGTAIAATPSGGRLVVMYPDGYVEPGVYDKPMVIEAPVGVVISGQ